MMLIVNYVRAAIQISFMLVVQRISHILLTLIQALSMEERLVKLRICLSVI